MATKKSSDQYEVIGPVSVCGTAPGGTVTLDPDRVNVPALVAAGHVRKVEPSGDSPRPSRTARSGADE